MTTVRADTFTRANQTGWGTASDGNTWTVVSGNGQSIASNEGQITGSTASTFATLGAALTGADAEGLVRFAVTDTTHNTAGIVLRWTDASNHWLGRFNGASGAINVMCKVAGTYTSQANIAVSVAIGTFYWLRFRCQGTTISIRFWQDGTTEPATWNGQYTLSTQNVAGMVGLYGYASGSSTTHYDTYSVDDLVTGPVLAGESDGVSTGNAALTTSAASFAGESDGVATASATLTHSVPLAGEADGAATAAATLTTVVPGTGIGDITRSTGTQTANKSGNGYGVGDITGTEYDYAYKDATGSGWAVGANPWYGGMPISAWYQLDPTLNTTLPQQTSATGNLMSLLTTQSGGIVHWEEAVGGTYAASELPTFSAGGNFTELAPASTAFRAYLKAVGDAADANGISWTAYACIYPGDPGLVVFRFDQHNGTASAISVDESDVELIASLLTDTGQNPTGIWSRANGFIGTIGGTPTVGWPAAGVHQTGTFDYLGVTPDSGHGISLGTGAAVVADPSVQFSWSTGGYEANDSGVTTTPGRIKIGFYSGVTTAWNIPAGQTNTYYVLRAFRRNLTSSDMAAIAADFKYPGTPTATTGSFTQFNTGERAYEFAASANALSATLDLSPAHVTARYKPIVKVTGWTGGTPALTWGGSALVNGVDYRYTIDTSTSILYIQLYCDVVTSGAVYGQRNNAALALSSLWSGVSTGVSTGSGSLTVAHALTGEADGASTAAAALTVAHPLAGASNGASTAVAALTHSVPLAGESDGVSTGNAALTTSAASFAGESDGVSTAAAGLIISHALAGEADGASTSNAALTIAHALAGEADGVATAAVALTISHPLSGEADGVATASAGLITGAAWGGESDGASTASSALTIAHALSGEADGIATASVALLIAHALAATATGVSTASATLTIGSLTAPKPSGVTITATSGPAGVTVALAGVASGVSVVGS